MNCFEYNEVIKPSKQAWDSIIDCCYVLIMENSKNEKNVLGQIRNIPISRIVLQYNKGYKNCLKKNVKSVSQDVWSAYKQACTHALQNDYNRILLLEEDFIIDERIQSVKIQKDISHFIKDVNPPVYNLGPHPFLANAFDVLFSKHLYLYLFGSTQAIVVNEKCMKWIVNFNNEKCKIFKLIDILTSWYNKSYCYHIPIVYQTWPKSLQSLEWIPLVPPKYSYEVASFLGGNYLFKLNKQHQPGFDYATRYYKLISIILHVLCIYIVWNILKSIFSFLHI
jgi:hypothetical protein